jgi:hypothetical protein
MKISTALFFLILSFAVDAQRSDFIVVKKHNNRTLKTYSEGSFLSAETYGGFQLNGFIRAIRNDSIILQQYLTQLVPTEFGQKLDTMVYTMGIHYTQIKKFFFNRYDIAGRKKGFLQISAPRLLVIGGVGYIVLELVNTAYRGEALNDGDKLKGFAIAAGVAATGFLWNAISNNRNRVGGKYKIVYVKAGALEQSK